MKKEDKLVGITIVPGKGVGSAYFVGRGIELPSKVTISRQNVGDQIMLFNAIREKAKQEYHSLSVSPPGLSPSQTSAIVGIYEQILDDPSFIGQVVETISTKLYDLETSIRLVLNDFVARFNAAGTPYLKERSGDIVEVCEKLVSFLHEDDGRKKTFMEPVVLIVLRMFTPSDILAYDKSKIQAVVCVSGGKTSHAAILARAYSIPVVSGIRDLQKHIYPGEQVFVDADKATVHIRPHPSLLSKAVKQKTNLDEMERLICGIFLRKTSSCSTIKKYSKKLKISIASSVSWISAATRCRNSLICLPNSIPSWDGAQSGYFWSGRTSSRPRYRLS
jgi:phosphotransferase system enzyme I (PtsI)